MKIVALISKVTVWKKQPQFKSSDQLQRRICCVAHKYSSQFCLFSISLISLYFTHQNVHSVN